MPKQYVVALTPEQREQLQRLVSSGQAAAAAINHARILLKADAAPGGPAWKDTQISDAFDLSVRTVVRVRQAFVYRGLAGSIERKSVLAHAHASSMARTRPSWWPWSVARPPPGACAGRCAYSAMSSSN